MATYNSSSATSSYPLPHADNPLNVDVGRLRAALEVADAQVSAMLPIASYTAADVMVKVKSLDGTGSGLDADTLDGLQAADFAMASHTHAEATSSASGFMAATDKVKMDGIGAGANVISVNAKTGVVTLAASDVGASPSSHTHADATTNASGFMPAAALSKLNGIGAGANVISVNAKTGALTLNYADVGASPSSHTHADASGAAAGFMAAADKTKLDGISSASYIAAGIPYNNGYQVAGLSANATIAGGPYNFYEVRGTGGAAALAFHRPGVFAGFLGIDSDNHWKVGGWSYGPNSYKLWHEGNDGAGSGLDADTLDGQHATAFAAAAHTHPGIDAGTLQGNPASAFAAAVHTHTGGQVPVVKSVQNGLVNFSGAGTQNVTITAVDPGKSAVILNTLHVGSTAGVSQAYLTTGTNIQIVSTGAVGNVRFQIVEFY